MLRASLRRRLSAMDRQNSRQVQTLQRRTFFEAAALQVNNLSIPDWRQACIKKEREREGYIIKSYIALLLEQEERRRRTEDSVGVRTGRTLPPNLDLSESLRGDHIPLNASLRVNVRNQRPISNEILQSRQLHKT